MTESRYSLDDKDGQFSVEIRTQKNIWFIIAIVGYFGLKTPHRLYKMKEIIQRGHIFNHPDPLMLGFFILLTLLLLASVVMSLVWLAWSLFGKEVVTIERGREELKTQYWLWGNWFTHTYRLNQIHDLKAEIHKNPVSSIIKGGNIRFGYEGKTRRFGWTLTQEDAEAICQALQKHVPEQVIRLVQ